MKDQDLWRGRLDLPNVESGAKKLIPVEWPLGGVLVLGENSICHFDGNSQRTVQMKATEIESVGKIDNTRYLLGDHTGCVFALQASTVCFLLFSFFFSKLVTQCRCLMLLVVEHKNNKVTGLKLELIGNTSVPSCISYLDNGVVYVGSALSDSHVWTKHSTTHTQRKLFQVDTKMHSQFSFFFFFGFKQQVLFVCFVNS